MTDTTAPSETPQDNPEVTALLTQVEATHLSGGQLGEALWLELERSELTVERLSLLLVQDMQLQGSQSLRLAENPKVACPKIRTVLRTMAARYTFSVHQLLVCRISVLAHHGRGKVARPDLQLITEMLDGCTARGRTLLGTLGELFTKASWTRTDQAHVQPCLDAVEAHL